MRYTSSLATVAAFASIALAGDAPVVHGNPIEDTYSATIPEKVAGDLSGAIKIAASPDGEGVNIQIALYNLPDSGDLNYGIYSGNVASLDDCSGAGSYFNPYNGITGDKCKSDKAACAVGDLSDKYGAAEVIGGGSGTGYFTVNYPDKYLSMVKGDEAFFGDGSFVVTDASGAYVACANFVNANNAPKESKQAAKHATETTASSSAGATGKSSNGDASSTSSGDFAIRTTAPLIGAGVMGLAALLI